ncbi:hypothetical protein [Streptacidiphilus jiangxiensis]|uniref:Uncharacterized protein n=1 Tax=Streptacidiphilus jiangxiensis TaxID=235985 RepID=A0A1H7VMT0_STRJI|nr:hypothetical protein [Streptacidiphilus jiangxiensis]SEM10107.1 hypothetical protein SAMN05414137_118122 [Streptacidiphilus jiangxiensis]
MTTQTVANLDELAEYPADWQHTEKRIHPGENLSLPDAYLKWYDIRTADQDATPEVSDEAREFLRTEAAEGRVEFRKEFGHVLLHRCDEKYFMIVCVWRNKNEMCQTIYYKDDAGFLPYVGAPGTLRATQEVVELDATSHERRAWSRYLLSDRSAAAKQAYIDDACTGQLI